MNLITELNQKYKKAKITDFKVGDTVRVHQKIIEGGKERVQIFEGVVIKTRGGKNINGTFTVRKISEGVGVERIYLVHSPKITKIEVVKRGKVRRANLSYLRNLRGKKARLKEKQFDSLIVNVAEEKKEEVTASNAAGAAQDADKADEITEQPNNGITEQQSNSSQAADDSSQNKGEGGESNDKQGGQREEELSNDSDKKVTELSPADEEDEEKLKEMSTEKLAEMERKASEKAHRKEEENVETDETEDIEEEIDHGLEKAEDEDTRGQSKKSK